MTQGINVSCSRIFTFSEDLEEQRWIASTTSVVEYGRCTFHVSVGVSMINQQPTQPIDWTCYQSAFINLRNNVLSTSISQAFTSINQPSNYSLWLAIVNHRFHATSNDAATVEICLHGSMLQCTKWLGPAREIHTSYRCPNTTQVGMGITSYDRNLGLCVRDLRVRKQNAAEVWFTWIEKVEWEGTSWEKNAMCRPEAVTWTFDT